MNFLTFFTIKRLLIYIGLPLLVLMGGLFYKKYTFIPQDNPVEELIEDYIDGFVNVYIDLSPDKSGPDSPDPYKPDQDMYNNNILKDTEKL